MKKCLYIIFCFLFAHLASAQINVIFTFTVETVTCDAPFPLLTAAENSTSSAGEIVQWYWYGPSGQNFDTTSSISFNINPLVDSLCLQVWDDQGNTGSLCLPIVYQVNNTPPIADAGPDEVITCAVSEVVLDGSGSDQGPDYVYQWNTPNGIFLSGANTLNPLVGAAGIYELVVTNTSNGCTAVDEVIVTEDLIIPDISLTPNEFTICSPVLTLNFTNFPNDPNLDFNWSVEGAIGEILDQSNPEMPIFGSPGVYALEAMDTNNGCTTETYITVYGDTTGHLSVGDIFITPTTCSGDFDGAIQLEVFCGFPPYEYEWNTGYDQGPDYFNIPEGIYTVTITDANDSTFVTDPIEVPSFSDLLFLDFSANTVCPGEDLCLSVVVAGGCPPYSFEWDNNVTTPDNCFPDPQSGDYCITVTDCNGCQVAECFTLSIPDSMEIIVEDYSCPSLDGSELGLIDISVSGGIPPYLYSWTSGETTQDIQPSYPMFSYAVTVTDASGCTAVAGPPWHNPIILAETPDTNVCVGEEVTLSILAPTADSIHWFSGGAEVFSCNNCPATTMEVLPQTTWIGVIAFAEGSCYDTVQIWVTPIPDCVWPGDTDTNGIVNNFDLLPIGLAYDSIGPPRSGATIAWNGQEAADWQQFLDTVQVNYKHIDTDGNGLIDASDTLGITQNFGNTHNFLPEAEENFFDDLPISDGVQVIPFYVQPDTLIPGATAILPIILGDQMNPIQDLYGMAFTINYDTSIVEFGSAKASFSNSWLGEINQNMISVQQDHPSAGQLDLALTRIDGVNVSGDGQLASFIIIIQDDILLQQQQHNFGGGSNPINAVFSIQDVYLINFDQQLIPVEPQTTESVIVNNTVNLENITLTDRIKIFPNPASNYLSLFTNSEVKLEKAKIYNLNGQVVKNIEQGELNQGRIRVGEIPSGIYLMELFTNKGVVNKKLILK